MGEIHETPAKPPEALRLYEDGKHRRYNLLFAVNGGGFTVARLFAEGHDARLLGNLTLSQLAWGMVLFTVVMVADIFMFGENMKKYAPRVFRWQGKTVLMLIGFLICAGWLQVA